MGRSEGKEIREAKWVKCHVMCGVKTNIITAVDVTANESADAPYLAPFVETTAKNFTVRDVTADKAYLSRKNLHAVDAVGGDALHSIQEQFQTRQRRAMDTALSLLPPKPPCLFGALPSAI